MDQFTTGQLLLTFHLCVTFLALGATLLSSDFELFKPSYELVDKVIKVFIFLALTLLPILNVVNVVLLYIDMKRASVNRAQATSLNELVRLIMVNKDFKYRDSTSIYNDKLNIRITTSYVRHDDNEMPISKANKKLLLDILSKEDKYSSLLDVYKQQKKA